MHPTRLQNVKHKKSIICNTLSKFCVSEFGNVFPGSKQPISNIDKNNIENMLWRKNTILQD